MKSVLVFLVLLASNYLWAAPAVTNVVSMNSDTQYKVTGTGFGAKAQAAPVLWVMGRDVRENGTINTDYNTSIVNDEVPVGAAEIWTGGIAPGFDAHVRYPELELSYLAKNDGWLGWPSAYGGGDTPAGTQAYISFRMLPWWSMETSRSIGYSSIEGTFNTGSSPYLEGEDIVIATPDNGPYFGRIIHVNTDTKVIQFTVAGINANYLTGAEMQGTQSNAVATLDRAAHSVSGLGGKYLRSYENAYIGGGIRVTRSGNRFTSGAFRDDGENASPRVVQVDRAFEQPDDSDMGYYVAKVSNVKDWRLMETYIDLRGPEGEGYNEVDSRDRKWFYGLDLTHKDPNAGPTISNMGWEAAGGTEHINFAMNFGEIYFDKTPQRVVISSQPNYSDVTTDLEYQFPLTWTDTEITVEIKRGAFNQPIPLFLYVFDRDNNVNAVGYPLCPSCKFPAKSPTQSDMSPSV